MVGPTFGRAFVCAKLLQLCLTLCNPVTYSPPGSSVHGILWARILEWVAMPSSRGSSQPRDQTCISTSPALTDKFFTTSTTDARVGRFQVLDSFYSVTLISVIMMPAKDSFPLFLLLCGQWGGVEQRWRSPSPGALPLSASAWPGHSSLQPRSGQHPDPSPYGDLAYSCPTV